MAHHRQGTNYYEILEVERDAPQNEIHKAYQRAKSTYSADNPALYSMFSKDEARELVRMIEEAYAVLGNQAMRKSYDESLMGKADPLPAVTPVSSALDESPSQFMPEAPALGPVEPSPMSQNARPEPSRPADFKLPESTGDGYTVRIKESPSAAAGMGRTSVSNFKIDEEMETDIANRTEWDGAALQKIRLYKGVTIDQISESSRVSRTYLMAVETNDFKALPAAVFVRGFVIQIARILGLDENKVAASYMKMFKEKTAQK